MLYVVVLVVGCTTDEAPKTSLFEDDHHIAAHWPSDLADLSAKLSVRIASVKTGSPIDDEDHHHEHGHEHDDHDDDREPVPMRDQIEDLVDWVGEIAADTNLSEADWIPLYEKSESVSANLKSNSGELTDDDLRELESLCQLIDDSIPKIPEHLASVKATSP